MRAPRLTVNIHNQYNDTRMTNQLFSLPGMVGRSYVSAIRLQASTVSRYHGAFLLWAGSLRFVDFGSSNGTTIDGVRVEADVPIAVGQQTLIEIGPYHLTLEVHSVVGDESEDATGSSPEKDGPNRSPTLASVPAIAAPERARVARVPDTRAQEVTAVLVDLFARFRASEIMSHPGLVPGNGPAAGRILAYLTEPDAPSRLEELRATLAAIFERAEETCIRERLC
jgi:pSer/pThr/pTyr-binding forkhead associated (FHA) protein